MPTEAYPISQEDKPKRSKGRVVFVVALILLTAASLTTGIVLNQTLKQEEDDQLVEFTDSQVDCQPGRGGTKEECKSRGCLWKDGELPEGPPRCVFPEKYEGGYKAVGGGRATPTAKGVEVSLTLADPHRLYGMEPFLNVTISVEFQTDNRLRIKIYPEGENRFEIPEEALSIDSPAAAANESTRLYDVTFTNEPVFGVKVTRKSSNVTILDTSLPGLLLYPQLLQISTRLGTAFVYGLGEHRHETFRHDMHYRTWSIFTRDAGPDSNWNLYGAHPVYMNVEEDGKANMVFLKNSNAMEVFLQPDPYPALTFRTIGGVLDFYVFLGDSPGDAVSQYTQAIGRPVLPPYWALGYQLSRWGYKNVSDMRMVVERNRQAGIPFDVQWGDIDTMYKKYVFTVDREQWAGLPDLVRDLKQHHQHYITIVDPGIGANDTIIAEAASNSPGYHIYQDGVDADIFVKDSNGSVLYGEVWPGITAFPDFADSGTIDWFKKYLDFYINTENVSIDALWIDMNEPTSFVAGSVDGCEKTKWDNPPYVPNVLGAGDDGRLYDKTVCMTARSAWGKHYDTHSLYAHAMAMRTHAALQRVVPGKRAWVMTRSSFAGTGRYASKWMGDNQARWPAMHWSIIGIFEFSIFGFAMNGADICGFWYETTFELCVRWHQLGAFYPFARNHNGRGEESDLPTVFKHQDPGAFDARFVYLVKQPLMTRYKFLPYIYTHMYRAHLLGTTVMRPLMFEFPKDIGAREIDTQFLLGPALLVSPVLKQNATSVDAYFPRDARWYNYFTGEEIVMKDGEETVTLHTPLDKYNLHIRGGYVLPWQTPGLTTYESRKNSMGLLVALNKEGTAEGELYWDDGESLVDDTSYSRVTFNMTKAGELLLEPVKTDYSDADTPTLQWTEVDLYGLQSVPATLTVNGKPHPPDKMRMDGQIVRIWELSMRVFERNTITWTIY